MTERIALIGMMGVGKTTVGRALADRLGWTYLDSDEQVRAATGRSVKEISVEDGPEALHRFEDEALATALEGASNSVIGVAGGALLDEHTRALLKAEDHVVWLRATPETMRQRIGMTGERPYFQGDPSATIDELYAVRRPLYEEVAGLTIDVDERTPDEIAESIMTSLHLRSR
jgi:shikimate kinase